MKRLPRLGWLEGTLWLLAASFFGMASVQVMQAHGAQADAKLLGPSAKLHGSLPNTDALIGRLEIPRIGLTVPIVDDYDTQNLVRGVGHIPGSALPGGLGNLVLAGHRDTFFRPLRNVRTGMQIDIVTAQGQYRYLVDTTEIVTPEHVEVLDIGERPGMTLITCFPFDFVGPAPKRFIVHAHLLSVEAA